jgi:hypothetical protein
VSTILEIVSRRAVTSGSAAVAVRQQNKRARATQYIIGFIENLSQIGV